MASGPNPSVSRRRIRVELRRLRLDAKLTQRQVADDLDWSVSKVLRIEAGQVGVSRTDLKALLERYGVTDPDRLAEYIRLADETRGHPWAAYSDVFNPEYRVYLGYEGAASIVRQFELLFVPGVLQTRAYAEALIRAIVRPGLPPETIERMVDARMARQEILDRSDPPELRFILDEAVIRRGAGDPGVMRAQLDRLVHLSERPSISIQILPFSLGPHYGLRGSFIVLEFGDPEVDDLLYLENFRGSVLARDDTAEVVHYKDTFLAMEKMATPPEELGSVVDRVLRELAEDY